MSFSTIFYLKYNVDKIIKINEENDCQNLPVSSKGGITQKQLAEDLNISTTTLNGYIKNRRQPDAKTVIRLASYFSTTTDYIYGISTLREIVSSPFTAEERHLVNIFRGMPEDKRSLYLETGRTFSNFGRKKKST